MTGSADGDNEPVAGPPEATAGEEDTPAAEETPDPSGAGSWWQRWWVIASLAGVVIVGLVVGLGVQQARMADLQGEVRLARGQVDTLSASNDELRGELEDREAQRRADEAATARIEAEQEAAEREAAEQAAAEQAAQREREAQQAAEAAREAEAAQEREQKEQELRNTLPGDGIVAIGPEKNAGTYRTDGPGRRDSCYYAVLNAPSGRGSGNIITNNIIRGPGIVVVADGQFFESSGCQSWKRQ